MEIMLRTNLDLLTFMDQYCKENPKSGISLKTFPTGLKLITQGEIIKNVFVVKEGITKCFISEENGKDFIVEFLGKGEIVGELELLKQMECLCNVSAISEVLVYAIPKNVFVRLCEKNGVFNKLLLQELSTRIIQTSSRASFQQLYTIEYGLLKLMKLQAEEKIKLSKEDMAAYLGIPIRSFNRTLKSLIDQKVIPAK